MTWRRKEIISHVAEKEISGSVYNIKETKTHFSTYSFTLFLKNDLQVMQIQRNEGLLKTGLDHGASLCNILDP